MAKRGNIHPTRIFRTPEALQEVWDKYKLDLIEKAKQWPKVQYVGKDGDRRIDYPILPLTLEGLKRYCHDEGIGEIGQYFDNKDQLYEDFVVICSRIRNEIREQQIMGGMVGAFNPSITQRLNGLVDKKETEVKGEPRIFNIN